MKKTLLLTLVVALVLGAWGLPAQARSPGDSQPVAVISFAGYDRCLDDVELVGKLSGNPDLAKGLEAMLKLFTRNRGLAGLDKSRAWGAVVECDGSKPTGYAFLPVSDLEQLLDVLEPFAGRAERTDDGIYKITTKKKDRPLYVKQKKGWAIVAHKPEHLDRAPADPLPLLGELPDKYDLALRIHFSNLPPEMHEKFVVKLKRDAEKDLSRRPGEDDIEYAVRKRVSEEIVRGLITTVGDLEQVTIGWALDQDLEKSFLDVNVVAKPDTHTARQFARLGRTETRFGGFRLPGAAIAGNWVGELSKAEADTMNTVLEAIHTKACEDIDKKSQSEAKTKAEKQFLGEIVDLLRKTVSQARVDGAVAVILKSQAATLVGGGFVADGSSLDKLVRRLAEMAQDDNPAVANWINLDADRYKDVRLHTLSIPIPEDAKNRDKVIKLIGPTLDIVVGAGEKSVYVAAGREAMKTLKQAIGTSAEDRRCNVPPVQWSVALGPIARFAAEMGKENDRAKAAMVASVLEKMAGKDHVHLAATPIERGLRVRLEMEEGILRLIGAMGTMHGGGLGVRGGTAGL